MRAVDVVVVELFVLVAVVVLAVVCAVVAGTLEVVPVPWGSGRFTFVPRASPATVCRGEKTR